MRKWIVLVILIVVAFLPVFRTCESVPYQTMESIEVPVKYDYSHHVREAIGFFDWELEYVCTIENIDDKGGTFTVTAKFYDGDRLAYIATDRKYIGPGQTATFMLKSSGLSYSTDWRNRYKVYPEIQPPTKIETHIVTKYRTECRAVSLIQLLLGI